MNRKQSAGLMAGMAVLLVIASNRLGAAPDSGAMQVVLTAPAPVRVATVTPPTDAPPTDAPLVVAPVADVSVAQAPLTPVVAADPCATSLEVFAQDNAMIGLTLLAPCHGGQRVVLRHGGLAVAMRTLATGSLFATLPAIEVSGAVEVRFDDGTRVQAAVAVPELARLRRFAVQWQDADRFAVQGFEAGADYGDPGHRTVANGGVVALGDPAVAPALMAEVYTLPDPSDAVVTVEAEVTAATCGRELLGEMLLSQAGVARVSELTLAMPACDALGGFVVLNNPFSDMTLAVAE